MNPYYVYILAKRYNGTLYTGVTNDLVRRVYEHKNDIIKGFTSKYGVKSLVYYEIYDSIEQAIIREKTIKGWVRSKKVALIEEMNKPWEDLYSVILSVENINE